MTVGQTTKPRTHFCQRSWPYATSNKATPRLLMEQVIKLLFDGIHLVTGNQNEKKQVFIRLASGVVYLLESGAHTR